MLASYVGTKGAQDASAQGGLHLEHGIPINATGRVEDDTRRCDLDIGIPCHFLKHPIDHANEEVHMLVQAGAEPMNEGDCADVQRCLVCIGRTGAVGLQALRNDPQEDAQHHGHKPSE